MPTIAMKTLLTRTLALSLVSLLTACATGADRPVVGNADAAEAAIRLESSKRAYQSCIENAGPGQPTCDRLEALYEQDRQQYERDLK